MASAAFLLWRKQSRPAVRTANLKCSVFSLHHTNHGLGIPVVPPTCRISADFKESDFEKRELVTKKRKQGINL